MGEAGLSASEVGKEIAEHRKHQGNHRDLSPHERRVSVLEAILLAVVAILAAYSGFASAKWGTEQSLTLSRSTSTRTDANRLDLDALEARNLDAIIFDSWFDSWLMDDAQAMDLAGRSFSPQLQTAFDAWWVLDPANDRDAPGNPLLMDEYDQPDLERAHELEAEASALYEEGVVAGRNADDYVRITVYLASVLFLIGISGQFRVPAARYTLVGLGSAILAFSVVLLLTTPTPPG